MWGLHFRNWICTCFIVFRTSVNMNDLLMQPLHILFMTMLRIQIDNIWNLINKILKTLKNMQLILKLLSNYFVFICNLFSFKIVQIFPKYPQLFNFEFSELQMSRLPSHSNVLRHYNPDHVRFVVLLPLKSLY